MRKLVKKNYILGVIFIALFVILSLLLQSVDVKPLGQNGTNIGFSTFNCWFFNLTGVHMTLYTITDWLGLVPIFVCLVFASFGLVQLVKRKSLFKVDADILVLGVYYIVVVFCYLFFETVEINFRPVLINGFLETSYPSSTTLLVLGVMPTLIEQANRRIKNLAVRKTVVFITFVFSFFMVLFRLISGVHWFTDILGSVLLCTGLFLIYKATVLLVCSKN